MNIKTPVATAILVASFAAVSACDSSAAKSGAAATAATASTASTTSAATSAPAASTPATPAPAESASPSSQAAVRSDIPDSALMTDADLAAAPTGALKSTGGSPTVAAAEMFDVDHCDPVPHPQAEDPNYPRNPAWVNTRTRMWVAPGYAQVSETVVTYKSAGDARADFARHQGWTADCAPRFQWTDAPQKFAVSAAPLPGVSDAYAVHVGMYGPDQPASSAGSQGYDYMAVILRGNSLTVLDVSQTAVEGPKPQDPGPGEVQHDVQAAAAKLAAVYAPSK